VQISIGQWNQLEFPSGDVMIVQFSGGWGKLTIFNIYNKGISNNTINLLTNYYSKNQNNLEHCHIGNAHML
jgi:hypothetical protein